jgi:predicted nucleic acid-binding Zn ribbon protein
VRDHGSVPWSPLPDADGPPPAPVGESVDRVLRALGAPPSTALSAVFDDWGGVVGEAIASASHPVSIDAGCLVVAVRDGGWATQLRWMETELLAKVGARIGEGVVRSIEVRVRPS